MFKNWRLRDWVLFALVIVGLLLGIVLLITGLTTLDGTLSRRVEDGEVVQVFLPGGDQTDVPVPMDVQEAFEEARDLENQVEGTLLRALELLALTIIFVGIGETVAEIPGFFGICISNTGGRCCVLLIYMLFIFVAIVGSIVGAVINYIGQLALTEGCKILLQLLDEAECVPCEEDSLQDCVDASNDNFTATVTAGGNPFANGNFPTYCFYSEKTESLICDDLTATVQSVFVLMVFCIISMILAGCCACFVCCGRDEQGDSYMGYAKKERISFAR